MEQHRADCMESKEKEEIEILQVQKRVQWNKNGMEKAVCEATEGQVRFLGCLNTLLLFFMFWEVTNVTGTGGTGHLKNHPFHVVLGKVLSWPWVWARALGCMISRSAFQPQLSCVSVVLISVLALRVNISPLGDFPLDRNQCPLPWNWFFSRQWLILTTYLEQCEVSDSLYPVSYKTSVWKAPFSALTVVLPQCWLEIPRKTITDRGHFWWKSLFVKKCWKVESWSLAVLFSSEERTGTVCVCLCVLPPCNYSSGNYCNYGRDAHVEFLASALEFPSAQIKTKVQGDESLATQLPGISGLVHPGVPVGGLGCALFVVCSLWSAASQC